MAKKVVAEVKIQIPAGKATPAPPVGTALGPHGINIVGFTKEFNDKTKSQGDMVIPVIVTIYSDRSFTFVTKTPPAAVLIKKACGLDKASGVPNKEKVGSMTWDKIMEIAKLKTPDLTGASLEANMRMIAGTARSLGVTVSD